MGRSRVPTQRGSAYAPYCPVHFARALDREGIAREKTDTDQARAASRHLGLGSDIVLDLAPTAAEQTSFASNGRDDGSAESELEPNCDRTSTNRGAPILAARYGAGLGS